MDLYNSGDYLFSGVQLLGIGLLGEYLGRLYLSASKLPRATVRETINCDCNEIQRENYKENCNG